MKIHANGVPVKTTMTTAAALASGLALDAQLTLEAGWLAVQK